MEKKLIRLWLPRFNTVNKGIMRVFAIFLTIWVVLCFVISVIRAFETDYYVVPSAEPDGIGQLHTKYYYNEALIGFLLIGLGGYLVFILIFRLILWVIDGFKESK